MFESMLKTMLPDFDMEKVKAQAMQFAQMIAEMRDRQIRIEAKQDEILARLQPLAVPAGTLVDAAQGVTVTHESENDNGHQCLSGNPASSPSASQ